MNEQDMNKVLSKAEVLIEALPYIQKFISICPALLSK